MKCPHCEYEHGWSGEKLDIVEGEHGEFFELSNSIQMERKSGYHGYGSTDKTTRDVYGCPACKKLFMD